MTNSPTPDTTAQTAEEVTKTMIGQLIAEIMRFHGESKDDASRLATILLPHIDSYAKAEVTRKQQELLDELYSLGRGKVIVDDKDGWREFAESLIQATANERNTLKGKK